MEEEEIEQQQTNQPNSETRESEKEIVKEGAKTAANTYAGPAGGKVVDALSKTKVGNEIIEKGADALEKVKKRIIVYGIISLFPIFIMFFVLFIAVCVVLGIFSDDSNGTASNTTCTYNYNGTNISNVKIRLLNCEGNTPVEGEELVDFEKYITGVVYQEVGNISYEAMKVQAIAARSFALTRPKVMGGAYGVKMEQEGDNWIIQLRSCTNDQVYCDPDKGCWSNRTGGQTNNNNKADWPNCTVHSGHDTTKKWSRGPLAQDSEIRKAVAETAGQIFVDTNGKIVNTDYTNTNQMRWDKLAKEGKDAYEILVAEYGPGNISNSSSDCTSDGSIDGTISDASVAEIVKWNQSTAWKNMINKNSSSSTPSISQSEMDRLVTSIEVPYRKWANSSGSNPRTDTVKATRKITVNKAIAPVWKAFFEDLYQNAPDFVIVSFDGCYYYRNGVNGGGLSAHAYGAACDINAGVTGNGNGTKAFSKEKWEKLPNTRSKYSVIYKGSPTLQIAHKYTLINGADWSSSHDAMHFSFIRDWTRERAIKCQNKAYC